MTAAEFVTKLEKAKPAGTNRWMARCPSHKDANPSMSVAVGDDGRILLNCHANCEPKQIVADLGLQMKDLFPEEERPNARPTIASRYAYHDEKGELLYEAVRLEPKSFRQRRPDGKGGWIWNLEGVRLVPYRLPELLAADPTQTVYVCYSHDTEVLTPTGWVSFPLATGSVAQYDAGAITFVEPSAWQQFAYQGQMINIKAGWCDLLVTPDHRQPARFARCRPGVIKAKDVRGQHRIPVSGFMAGDADVSEAQARIIAAWQADGTNHRRGSMVSWNLKKERKKKRLRELLEAIGVSWTEHSYTSTPGWTSINVKRADLPMHLCNGKLFTWDMLRWPLAAKKALVGELGHWDGDHVGQRGLRFFTADEECADIASAVAASAGYGVIKRRDERPARENYVVQFVLNLVRAEERALGHAPVEVPYDGQVYCCTVPSGQLVVRRNGKITISGNCEGEKDVETLRQIGCVATTSPMGAGKWSKVQKAATEALMQRQVVVLPDNDKPGRDHAQEIAESLRGHSASVRIFQLPGLKEKGDVSDWVRDGGTAAKLGELLANTAVIPDMDGINCDSFGVRLGRERAQRLEQVKRVISFQVAFLDDVLGGIMPTDLILLTAKSGAGKTQLATSISENAALAGQRVTVLALESEEGEYERRIKYRTLAKNYRDGVKSAGRGMGTHVSYREWYLGRLDDLFGSSEKITEDYLAAKMGTKLHTIYRGAEFGIEHIERVMTSMSDHTDLFVVDHLHFIDLEDKLSENAATKKVMKRLRDTSLRLGKPVLLLAQMRKADRFRATLLPSMDDIHGSSDIVKICTRVIALGQARREDVPMAPDAGLWVAPTYIQVLKDRLDGAPPHVGLMYFDKRTGSYGKHYIAGLVTTESGVEKWAEVPSSELPHWAKGAVSTPGQPVIPSWERNA